MLENSRSSSAYFLGGLLSPVRARKSPKNLSVLTRSASTFKKSDSFATAGSPTFGGGLRRMKSKANESASRISDFYNKEQINEAISSLDGVGNRINAIDFILKRRVELKEEENQYKISKAAPIIIRLNKNFQKRILKNKLNAKGNTFKKVLLKLQDNENGLVDTPLSNDSSFMHSLKAGTNKSQASIVDSSFNNTPLPQIHIHRDMSVSESMSKNTKAPTLSLDEHTPVHVKEAQNFHKFRHLTFLLGKAKAASPKALVFGEGKDEIITWEQVVNSKTVVHAEEEGPKGVRQSQRKKSIDPRVYNLGQKYLENDLYKYLVKNGQRGNGTQIILNGETEPKEKRMKDIEAKVKSKYTKLVKDQVQSYYASPSRTNISSQENIAAGSKVFQKELMLNQGLSPTSMGNRDKNRRFTSFVTVRKIEVEPEPTQEDERQDTVQETLGGFNESFASWTETQLDNLYRENTKIKRKIKDLDYELDEERNRNRQKKIQDAKEKKKQELSNNTSEIMKAVRKKISY